jgi:glucose-1-phosphate thymidylyltransferase
LLGNGRDFGLKHMNFAYQDGAGGIAEALALTENFIGGDRCVLVLGDNIVEDDIGPFVDNFGRQKAGARILLKEIPEREHLVHLGVAKLDGERVVHVEEKPKEPQSPYAVTGVYMYDATVFDIVHKLAPSGRGEMEISDVNNAYIARGAMEYDVLTGFWGDAGESIDHYMTVINYVANHWPRKTPAEVAP